MNSRAELLSFMLPCSFVKKSATFLVHSFLPFALRCAHGSGSSSNIFKYLTQPRNVFGPNFGWTKQTSEPPHFSQVTGAHQSWCHSVAMTCRKPLESKVKKTISALVQPSGAISSGVILNQPARSPINISFPKKQKICIEFHRNTHTHSATVQFQGTDSLCSTWTDLMQGIHQDDHHDSSLSWWFQKH